MLLCEKSIKDKKIIFGAHDKNFRAGSYDLTIQKFITSEGQVEEEFLLAPQGMVKVISNEIIDLPYNIIGYVFVKTQLCNEGVLALNIGIVDPGFSGPLQSILINFGKSKIRISKNDIFSRISFHTLDGSQETSYPPKNITHAELTKSVKKQADLYMASTFMDVESTASKAADAAFTKYKESMMKLVPALAFVVALMTFFLNFGAVWLTQQFLRPQPEKLIELQSELENLKKSIQDNSNFPEPSKSQLLENSEK